jgi:hypothetical protein
MLVADGLIYSVPGARGTAFLEEPSLSVESARDSRPRPKGTWIRGIVVHTRMGLPVVLRSGDGPNVGWDKVLAKRFANDERQASCHVAIDADGSYACLADLIRTVTYHAGHVNEITVGVEMYQGADGVVYESTLETAVLVCDVLTRVLGIQRQYPREHQICRRFASPTAGVSREKKLAHVVGGARGMDFCGIYGHRNVTRNRGPGDPGDEFFNKLAAAGYEGWHVDAGDDLDVWSERQQALGIDPDDCDGIVGPMTRSRIEHKGRPWGMWKPRPGDGLAAA